jgi:hypothetical protein
MDEVLCTNLFLKNVSMCEALFKLGVSRISKSALHKCSKSENVVHKRHIIDECGKIFTEDIYPFALCVILDFVEGMQIFESQIHSSPDPQKTYLDFAVQLGCSRNTILWLMKKGLCANENTLNQIRLMVYENTDTELEKEYLKYNDTERLDAYKMNAKDYKKVFW